MELVCFFFFLPLNLILLVVTRNVWGWLVCVNFGLQRKRPAMSSSKKKCCVHGQKKRNTKKPNVIHGHFTIVIIIIWIPGFSLSFPLHPVKKGLRCAFMGIPGQVRRCITTPLLLPNIEWRKWCELHTLYMSCIHHPCDIPILLSPFHAEKKNTVTNGKPDSLFPSLLSSLFLLHRFLSLSLSHLSLLLVYHISYRLPLFSPSLILFIHMHLFLALCVFPAEKPESLVPPSLCYIHFLSLSLLFCFLPFVYSFSLPDLCFLPLTSFSVSLSS